MASMQRGRAAELMVVCLLLLCITVLAVGIHGQPNTEGFISIDCGLNEGRDYTDSTTNISYTSDAKFIETGTNIKIDRQYAGPWFRQGSTVRSFETGARNCYNLNPLKKGNKYLIRASFVYGNYKRTVGLKKKPLRFDLYLGVNLWKSINITNSYAQYTTEVMTVASAEYIWVCLVNTGFGVPFISSLELRPLKSIMYPTVNASSSLLLYRRLSMGSEDDIRFPDDPYDRIWKQFYRKWTPVSTNSTIKNRSGDLFEVPSAVLRTAFAPPANKTVFEFYWTAYGDETLDHFVMHFAEIQPEAQQKNLRRTFDVFLNGDLWSGPFTPSYLLADHIHSTAPVILYQHNFSLVPNASVLPPILNALEVYSTMRISDIQTHAGDVDAIMAVKAQYQLKRNWMGDPCAPRIYAWDGLNCSYADPDPPRIVTLNLSSSGLTGELPASIGNLKAITYLDLSNNSISGTLPNFLAKLSSLRYLNLTDNQLNGSIPYALRTKAENGELSLSIDGNPYLCINESSCQRTEKKIAVLIIVIVSVVSIVLLLFVVFVAWRFCRRRQPALSTSVKPQVLNVEDHLFQPESRQFTYNELEKITRNFERKIGEGGFGSVYNGFLENGTRVAVKLRSQSSCQGIKEFVAEAQLLTRVHHKNLVSLVGYCKDGIYMALVYEHMAEGSLQDHLRGKGSNARILGWSERLRIVLEAAQGLEYLHKGCSPPIIHRDVKTSNILLSHSLEAKIADFGLSKAFLSDAHTHVLATSVVGTPGYLDPESQHTLQLSEKSDVYSFGVVLMVLITGKPAILGNPEAGHIAQWVHLRLEKGNIADTVDPSLRGEYDVSSIWKIADVAMRCMAGASTQRPAMPEVVLQLKEGLALEMNRQLVGHGLDMGGGHEMEQRRMMPAFVAGGPAAR